MFLSTCLDSQKIQKYLTGFNQNKNNIDNHTKYFNSQKSVQIIKQLLVMQEDQREHQGYIEIVPTASWVPEKRGEGQRKGFSAGPKPQKLRKRPQGTGITDRHKGLLQEGARKQGIWDFWRIVAARNMKQNKEKTIFFSLSPPLLLAKQLSVSFRFLVPQSRRTNLSRPLMTFGIVLRS